MPRQPIPAPGFKCISGKRRPPKALGDLLWCQIRGEGRTAGWVDVMPWPVSSTQWIWATDEQGRVIEHPGDVVAFKAVNDD